MKRKPKPGLPRLFDRPKYRQRNIIERMFGWLKANRRIITRFDKLAKIYAALVSLACVTRYMDGFFQAEPSGQFILQPHLSGSRNWCKSWRTWLRMMVREERSYDSALTGFALQS